MLKAEIKGAIDVIQNIIGHFCTVTKHKWVVFKLCCKAGIPWRGLIHDLSKYAPTEFWEGVKYYQGNRSPIERCKEKEGYSKAWLHHKGRNKHHFDYWHDFETSKELIVIPYVYTIEIICDNLAAGIVYNGKNWTKKTQLNYWNYVQNKEYIHPKIQAFMGAIYREISQKGIDAVIQKQHLKEVYETFCSPTSTEFRKEA